MLEFTYTWSWQVKALIAMAVVTPVMVIMPFLQKSYGLRPESFFIAWFLGCYAAFMVMAKQSAIPVSDYYFPLWPMLFVFVLAFLFGGPGNILLIQSMNMEAIKPPSNAALPFAIVGLASTLAYVIAWIGGKILPKLFPPVQFSLLNILGLILIAVGTAAVMYKRPGS